VKVKDVCSSSAATCGPDTNLAEIVRIMWDMDCGCVPVVDENGKVLGMITDRDICIALATRHRLAREVLAREVITGIVSFCCPDDEIGAALKTMESARVRRLPVVDEEGAIVGILSLSDLIRKAGKGRSAVAPEPLLRTLKSILQPGRGRPPA
jgi:CBS domain-containing protein